MAFLAALAPLAIDKLKWATEQLASGKVQSYFNDGIAHMSDGTDTDQILNKIDSVLKEVQEVKDIASKMSRKLDEGVLNLRKDALRSHFETIESIFEKIQNCNDQAVENQQNIKDPKELEKGQQGLQITQELELQKAVDRVPEQLHHINGLLTDADFIRAAANLALQDSKDFLSYYKKMETLFTAYWGRVVQGIVLLKMAQLSSKVLFGEAPQTIKRHGEKLAAQVTAFYNVLGNDICLVAQSVLITSGTVNQRTPFAWSSGWGNGIQSKNQHVHEDPPGFFDKLISGPNAWATRIGPVSHGWNYDCLTVPNSSERQQYFLTVATDISAKSFDLTKNYPMRVCTVRYDENQYVTRFCRSEIQNGIRMQPDSERYQSNGQGDNKWYIKPVSVGSSNCYFEGVDGQYPGAKLVVTSTQNELEWRWSEKIDFNVGCDGAVDRVQFQLSAWG